MISRLIFIKLFFVSKIPINLLYSIGKVVKIINRFFIKYRIQVVNKNIQNAFPDLDQKQKINLQKQFYNYFFNILFEFIKSISFSKKNILKRVNLLNPETLNNHMSSNKPTILIGAHFNNWEWLFLRIGLINNIKLSAVYKPLSNKYFNYILLKIRSKFGAKLVPLKQWKYYILNNQTESNVFMFISDQVPEHKKIGERVDFLNQSTLFDKGAEKVAHLLDCNIFYMEMIMLKKGYYSVDFKKITHKEITKTYAQLLEKTITKQPQNWLWSHNRWKR